MTTTNMLRVRRLKRQAEKRDKGEPAWSRAPVKPNQLYNEEYRRIKIVTKQDSALLRAWAYYYSMLYTSTTTNNKLKMDTLSDARQLLKGFSLLNKIKTDNNMVSYVLFYHRMFEKLDERLQVRANEYGLGIYAKSKIVFDGNEFLRVPGFAVATKRAFARPIMAEDVMYMSTMALADPKYYPSTKDEHATDHVLVGPISLLNHSCDSWNQFYEHLGSEKVYKDDMYSVLSGLKEGVTIVIEGNYHLNLMLPKLRKRMIVVREGEELFVNYAFDQQMVEAGESVDFTALGFDCQCRVCKKNKQSVKGDSR
jgi:regulator of replication initiation timing